MTATDESKRIDWWLYDAFAALLLPLFVVALFIQCLGVYFTLGDSVPEPTDGDIAAYWVTAGIAVAIGLTGFGAAIVRGSGRAILGYLAMGALVLPAILILAVPRIDFEAVTRQEPEPLNSNYCYRTDSENCPGG